MSMNSKKIRPNNLMYLFFAAPFMPIHYLNTYIIYDSDKLIISRYYAKNGKMKKNILEIYINEVEFIGFCNDLKIRQIEESLSSHIGTYTPQEICFKLKSGKIVSLNAKPYSKKQCIEILNLFKCNKGKTLSRALNL